MDVSLREDKDCHFFEILGNLVNFVCDRENCQNGPPISCQPPI